MAAKSTPMVKGKCDQCGGELLLDDRTTRPYELEDDKRCGIPERQRWCPDCCLYYDIEAGDEA